MNNYIRRFFKTSISSSDSIAFQLQFGVCIVSIFNTIPIIAVSFWAEALGLAWFNVLCLFGYGLIACAMTVKKQPIAKEVILIPVFIQAFISAYCFSITNPYYFFMPSYFGFITMYNERKFIFGSTVIHLFSVLFFAVGFQGAQFEIPGLDNALLSASIVAVVLASISSRISNQLYIEKSVFLKKDLEDKQRSLVEATRKIEEQNTELSQVKYEFERKLEENEASIAHLYVVNEEKASLASVAGSDLKQPLRNITSFIQLIERRLTKLEVDVSVREYMAYVIDGAARMNVMVDDLLKYSDHQSTYTTTQVATVEVLQDIETNLLNLLYRENATLRFERDLPMIEGQYTQVLQLFQNLISNGIKFKRQGVKPVCQVKWEQQDHCYIFSVADNGIGMPASRLKDVFGLFTRLHDRGKYEGSGIGLALCRRIVLEAGGEIWAESVEGEGTTFKFSWPIPVSKVGKHSSSEAFIVDS